MMTFTLTFLFIATISSMLFSTNISADNVLVPTEVSDVSMVKLSITGEWCSDVLYDSAEMSVPEESVCGSKNT